MSDANPHWLLKEYFGYDAFRPLQEEIICAALKGQDVLVLMPTGGGKSICFQIPALLQEGLTVVVSPLIALMKDQVDQLHSIGAPATFLNSTLDKNETRKRLAELYSGKYKILYISPERLTLSGTKELFSKIKLERFVIDEAHCISEWGHDFRPEYRQFAELRGQYRKIPLMALTATATSRVREDIIKQLELQSPEIFTSSFDRSNLQYTVQPRQKPLQQILNVLNRNEGESGIIYCSTRKSTEEVASQLISEGINATAYHAGMDIEQRNKNQELFIHDKIQVICATIAFGMGINKPNVRFIIHYHLPKNLEGYYQETGRAGRDGLPGECLLLYSAKDKRQQLYFVDEISEEKEQINARKLLQQMTHYAESKECRRKIILKYFGEIYEKDKCDSCDNCLTPKKTFNGTEAALKFLACIYRIDESNSKYGRTISFGINHIVDIIKGTKNKKIKQFGHEKLSTYGIGSEFNKEGWKMIGNELVQLGFVFQATGRMPVIELTGMGGEWLKDGKERKPIELTYPITIKKEKNTKSYAGGISTDTYNAELFQTLKTLRRKLANEKSVPVYIIFSEKTLKEMSASCPKDLSEFELINGVGAKKLEEFGEIFTKEIQLHLDKKSGNL